MAFQSVDELNQLSFADCTVTAFREGEGGISMVLESLIVRAGNSQNTHYTDSYAGTTRMELVGGEILSGYREGYKYYDADGVLQSEIPDREMTLEEIRDCMKTVFAGAYLFAVTPVREENGKKIYALGLEIPEEDPGAVMESCQIYVRLEKAVFTWEHFANRVER